MGKLRKPFQGVCNIIRFNWHFYAFSALMVGIVMGLQHLFNFPGIAAHIIVSIAICAIVVSLSVSFYIYDLSHLYKLSWLNKLMQGESERIVNINAGFDETSRLLKRHFKNTELLVADFYNQERHTEISIKRARKAYPPFPGTIQVNTRHLPIQDNSVDKAFTILSAHEIRSEEERIAFFKEIERVLKSSGQVIVTEHLRDFPNFLAYNIGFLHFHSRATWLRTFCSSGLKVANTIKITPFITTFILEKHGTAS